MDQVNEGGGPQQDGGSAGETGGGAVSLVTYVS